MTLSSENYLTDKERNMKALVLFSVGVDSTTCLGIAVKKYGVKEVLALSVFYGQKHSKELEAADKIALAGKGEDLP